MKPEHEARRKIIREWMSLPKDKRQTKSRSSPSLRRRWSESLSSGSTRRYIMRWLLPRIGKP